jgi:hypothetical protein
MGRRNTLPGRGAAESGEGVEWVPSISPDLSAGSFASFAVTSDWRVVLPPAERR